MEAVFLLVFILALLPSLKLISPWRCRPSRQLTANEIRLIRIQPADTSDDIVCESTITTFSSQPEFHALSYAWGSLKDPAYITLDGCSVPVSRNLEQALLDIRERRQVKTLWVDALSINQQDVYEKNMQVQQMAFIYQRAKKVHVWLDPYPGPHSTYKMLAQEYWKRAWIVQEIGMALHIVIHYEDKVFEWTDFVDLARECSDCAMRPPQVEQVRKLDDLRRSRYTHRQPYHLGELLQMTQDSFCSEPRDKLYAFLGMSSDHSGNKIPVDYNKSLLEVYQDFLAFQDSSVRFQDRKRTELLYLAAHVRRLLTRHASYRYHVLPEYNKSLRKQTSTPWHMLHYLSFTFGSAHSNECPEQKNRTAPYGSVDVVADLGSKLLVAAFFAAFDAVVHAVVENARHSWGFYKAMSTKRLEAYWLPSQPERLSGTQWQYAVAQETVKSFKVRARFACSIMYLGPSLPELLASFDTLKSWTAHIYTIAEQVPYLPSIETLRGRNERLVHILTTSFKDNVRIKHICDYKTQQASNSIEKSLHYDFGLSTSECEAPRLFIGSDMTIGLVPSGSKLDDEVYQFWNISASAVIRAEDNFTHIIGRAGLVRTAQCDYLDWDAPTNTESFMSESHTSDLNLDLATLTYLSLDTVNLPGT